MNANQPPLNRMSAPGGEKITPEEYGRRKKFLDDLKVLSKSEYIEIIKILQKHQVAFSENQNGIFFNVVYLDQKVFDDLESFIEFTQTNRKILQDHDCMLSTLRKVDIPPT